MARRRRSSVRNALEYAGLRLPVALLRSLPFGTAFRLGERVGDVLYATAAPQRKIALTNLRIAFPDKTGEEHRAIFRESCRNLGRMVAEFCQMYRLDENKVRDRVVFADPDDWERKRQIIGTTGILILGGHFGNWELQAYAFGLYGTPIHFIHRPFRNPHITEFVRHERSRAGTGLISKRAAALEAVRVLRDRGIVGVPIDQNATGRWGVFADFFGVPASTHPGLARLAQLSGAPVHPAFLVRQNGGPRHEVVVGDEIEVVRTGDRDRDTRENLTRFNRVMEDAIRAHPDHWLWMHKRWKTRPPGEPSLY